MRSGCDTTTPCAHGLTAREIGQTKMATQSLKEALSQALACRLWPVYGLPMGMHGVSLGCKLIYIYWTHWGLNPGPSACRADVIPLHHVPDEILCLVATDMSHPASSLHLPSLPPTPPIPRSKPDRPAQKIRAALLRTARQATPELWRAAADPVTGVPGHTGI